jgi:His-Xaa-Ser system protein HxsD
MDHRIVTDLSSGTATFTVDPSLYPLDALYGAAYVFIDRCFVFLAKDEKGHVAVRLAPKAAAPDAATLERWAGEFSNELLSCAWRHQISAANRQVLEQVTSLALGGAMGPPSLDDLAKFDFSSQPLEDPLGIAMSWEEKYKKKDAKKDGNGATATEAPKP